VLALLVAAIADGADIANLSKLYKDKSKDFSRHVEPLQPDGIEVKAGLAFVCARLDKETHVLTTRVHERYSWTDARITWKPAEYGGIQKTSSPASLVWHPDIRLFNSFANSEERDDVNAVHLADGTTIWVPPAVYTTLCKPSDDDDDPTVHCHFSLGSWTFDTPSLHLDLFGTGADTSMYLEECPYVVKNVKASISHTKYDCCENTFDKFDITFDVVERSHEEKEEELSHDEKTHYTPSCRWPHCDD